MSETPGASPDSSEEIFRVIAELKTRKPAKTSRSVDLVLRLLKMLPSDAEVFAFVLGLRRGSVHHSWGDNGRSFWAHLYRIPLPAGGHEILVTLERDGGVADFIGIFDSRENGLRALRAIGKYAAL